MKLREIAEFENESKELKFKERQCNNCLLQKKKKKKKKKKLATQVGIRNTRNWKEEREATESC